MSSAQTAEMQQTWGGKIATYLFLAGLGAGAYLIGFILWLISPDALNLFRLGIIISAPLVIIGILFLIFDLGRKASAFLAFSKISSSWIARGTIIIITAFVIMDVVYLGFWIWPFNALATAPAVHFTLGSIIAIFAFLTLIYTGMVLGKARSISFWSARFLPALFLVSGLSTGIMCLALYLALISIFTGTDSEGFQLLARCNVYLIIVEAGIITIYFTWVRRFTDASNSVQLLLAGKLAPGFWAGVALAGLTIPFAFSLYEGYLSLGGHPAMPTMILISSIIGLIGGFMLRYVIISAGTSLPLNMRGIRVLVPNTAITIESQRLLWREAPDVRTTASR